MNGWVDGGRKAGGMGGEMMDGWADRWMGGLDGWTCGWLGEGMDQGVDWTGVPGPALQEEACLSTWRYPRPRII